MSGKSTCHICPIGPPSLFVYQNKFADQTLACFLIGPWILIGSQGLCGGDYGSKFSTLASRCVFQPWIQRFRGAPHYHRPRGAPSNDNVTSRGRNRWFQLERGLRRCDQLLEEKTCHLQEKEYLSIFFVKHFPHIMKGSFFY